MRARGPIAATLPAREQLAEEMMELARELFPLPRSLTGEGVRETLRVIGRHVALDVQEIPSGTPAFDWTVPPEWTVRAAAVRDSAGNVIVDVAESPLRLVGYSAPFSGRVTGAALLDHLHSVPEHPDWVPYRTSYYDRAWGFCVTEHERRSIDPTALYDVVVDTSLDDGSLTIGEARIPGQSDDEVVISTYTCHPTLANDNISGLAVAATLARHMPREGLRHVHRFLFAPSVIGALAWLSRNEAGLDRIAAGLIVSCVGDAGPLRYKRSRRGGATVDRAAALVVSREPGGTVHPFVPWGGDERQFCSPGLDLPFGSLSRSSHGTYPEYHTSADDLGLVSGDQLAGSLLAAARILDILEEDTIVERLDPRGEPQLGRRGLYDSIGSGITTEERRQALLWVLNQADGETTLLDVAERSGLPFQSLRQAMDSLVEAELVRRVPER